MPPSVEPALEIEDVWFSYGASDPVLRGVSLTAEPGQITMLVGSSGSGKTTLLKLAKGLLRGQRGSVNVLGSPVLASSHGRLDHRVAYIPQQLGLVRSRTVLENTLTGALWQVGLLPSLLQIFPQATIERAHQLLSSLGIAHKADELAYMLSGGERQRVAIARALMQQPTILLGDEFISQLDPLTAREILEVCRSIARDQVTMVISTHQPRVVREYADRVVVLRNGEKLLDCPAAEADRARLIEAFQGSRPPDENDDDA